jgi:formylglycine-generating enzyme required for sulfatase activity
VAEIFISYAREDIDAARRLAVELEKRGWSVFWDRRIPAGRRFADVIALQLDAAKCVIALWSSAASTSDWVLEEAEEALRRNILAPALIEAIRPPMGFRRIHAADLIGWRGEGTHEGFAQLLEDIAQYVPASTRIPERVLPSEIKPGEVRINPGDGESYVWIPPGEFQMGRSPGDSECSAHEKPSHKVRITRGFWLGQTPVTQAAYEKVMRENRSRFKGAQHPVENMTWDQARKYCEAAGGRLPTEAEWEYAARAGSSVARYGDLDAIAWYKGNSAKQTHPVKEKQPNSWGLYDMLGNVWDWVADWYEENYYQGLSSPAIDPKGPASGIMRVLRGGSWLNDPQVVRASNRGMYVPELWNYNMGFRCARDVIP